MSNQDKLDLQCWLNDQQAAEILGIGVRTLDRREAEGALTPQRRQVKGRKPERVWNPDEVSALAPARPANGNGGSHQGLPVRANLHDPLLGLPTLRHVEAGEAAGMVQHLNPRNPVMPTISPISPPLAELSESEEMGLAILSQVISPENSLAIIRHLVDELADARKPPKPWIDLKEASETTGLSRGLILRMARTHKIDAVRDGKIKVHREGLETMDLSGEAKNLAPKKKKAKAKKKAVKK